MDINFSTSLRSLFEQYERDPEFRSSTVADSLFFFPPSYIDQEIEAESMVRREPPPCSTKQHEIMYVASEKEAAPNKQQDGFLSSEVRGLSLLIQPFSISHENHVRMAKDAYMSYMVPGMEPEGRKAKRLREEEELVAANRQQQLKKRKRQEGEETGRSGGEQKRMQEQRKAVIAAARNAHIIDLTQDPPIMSHISSRRRI